MKSSSGCVGNGRRKSDHERQTHPKRKREAALFAQLENPFASLGPVWRFVALPVYFRNCAVPNRSISGFSNLATKPAPIKMDTSTLCNPGRIGLVLRRVWCDARRLAREHVFFVRLSWAAGTKKVRNSVAVRAQHSTHSQ